MGDSQANITQADLEHTDRSYHLTLTFLLVVSTSETMLEIRSGSFTQHGLAHERQGRLPV
ncbi:unnamed protein product [marine sediment metagenome]|uniref:Uncharacterized protein n=1 Tax=marine sediment metagenome TaxID=412755 RepID=X0T6N4_9ZZZZ